MLFLFSTRVYHTATFLATVRCLGHAYFIVELEDLNSLLLTAQCCGDHHRLLRQHVQPLNPWLLTSAYRYQRNTSYGYLVTVTNFFHFSVTVAIKIKCYNIFQLQLLLVDFSATTVVMFSVI